FTGLHLGDGVGDVTVSGQLYVAERPPPCTGDCHDDRMVTVDDLMIMVNVALGDAPVYWCAKGDADGSGSITVDEVVAGVGRALDGCPAARPTPTPSPTPGACPTATVPSCADVADLGCSVDRNGCQVCACCFEHLGNGYNGACCDFAGERPCYDLLAGQDA